MKIAIMARCLDDSEGVGIANMNLIDAMIEVDHLNSYVIFYKSKRHFGRYKGRPNVAKEVLFRAPGKLFWDQVLVPIHARKEKVDLIFNPKFTAPIFSGIPTVPVCQGTEYFVYPEFYGRKELLNARYLFPRYYKSAAKVITVSDDVKKDLHKYFDLPYDKMRTVYLSHSDDYYPRTNQDELNAIREKHNLPQRFILAVSIGFKNNKPYPGKNVENVVKAFWQIKDDHPDVKLVFAGNNIKRYISKFIGQEYADDPSIICLGWVPQSDMPYIYSLGEMLAFPSFLESFGLPIVEAMACGCPVVTSTSGACPEVAGDAAIVVDPRDVHGLSTALNSVLSDSKLASDLAEKGIDRARIFSWERSARGVVEICEELVKNDRSVERKAIAGQSLHIR